MSKLESIEKLRELRNAVKVAMADNPLWVCGIAKRIADEIQAEIDERFMELPVDADGVPIHVGDKLRGKYLNGNPIVEVIAIDYSANGWRISENECSFSTPNLYVHVKPRTVEDVLRECAYEHANGRDDEYGGTNAMFEKYAAELQMRGEKQC